MDKKIELYRITRDGEPTEYGPYLKLSSARNVASNQFGGYWPGKNSQEIHNRWAGTSSKFMIQKLIPIFKQIHPSGAFQLSLEWVDLDG